MRNDVTAAYIVTDVERLRRPMQQVTDFLLRAAQVKATANVLPLTEATPVPTDTNKEGRRG